MEGSSFNLILWVSLVNVFLLRITLSSFINWFFDSSFCSVPILNSDLVGFFHPWEKKPIRSETRYIYFWSGLDIFFTIFLILSYLVSLDQAIVITFTFPNTKFVILNIFFRPILLFSIKEFMKEFPLSSTNWFYIFHRLKSRFLSTFFTIIFGLFHERGF